MVTKTIPIGKEQSLEEGQLCDLIRKAMTATLSSLAEHDVPEEEVYVTRPIEHGHESSFVSGPAYKLVFGQDWIGDGRQEKATA